MPGWHGRGGGEGGRRAVACRTCAILCRCNRPALQIDVEGYEPHVLRGAKRLFLEHSVQYAFMEYSPGVAGKLCGGW